MFNFNAILNEAMNSLFNTDISLTRICVCLFFSLVVCIYIFFVYKKTMSNEFYSKEFNISLIIMGVITSSVILAIQSNLVVSLGMVGALSIVRFRTAIKSSLDLVFIYWSISVGIVCGASLFAIAIIMSILVTISIIVTKEIESPVNINLLVIHTDKVDNIKIIQDKLKINTSLLRLKNKTFSSNYYEVVYEYKTKIKDIEVVLSKIEEIKEFQIMSYDREPRI